MAFGRIDKGHAPKETRKPQEATSDFFCPIPNGKRRGDEAGGEGDGTWQHGCDAWLWTRRVACREYGGLKSVAKCWSEGILEKVDENG